MSELLATIRKLVASRDVRISEHGFDELSDDGISVRDAVRGIHGAVEVEEYPASGRGPAVLVLEYDRDGQPIHVVWGIPKGHQAPAVLITAYRPDPAQWDDGFRRRRK
ncbi:MAG: DUF4258 domain-containing protein [Gammaproteobacteria bacterium]|nr:DUF4258 domain-containing protein [Gammaproteobacteria bacterium]